RVVVIPMGSAKPLQNVVTVAKGNGKFTDPVAAVNSITDATATNPYLVLIAPGTYTLATTLVMKPYVDISGSGENITKLSGAISSATPDTTSAVVKGANHTTLSNLSISNTGGNSCSIGIYTTGLDFSARLQQVLVTVSGGSGFTFGICNTDHSSPIMTDVNVIVQGGVDGFNFGVLNQDYSSPIMTRVNTVAQGGHWNYGVNNSDHSSPIMTDVNTAAPGGGTTYKNYGVYNVNFSSPQIRRSTLAGYDNGLVHYESATATISQSTILNGVSGGGYSCVACDNGVGASLNAACL
ncbi:MAG: hypothetical protein Q8R42_09505, partial [Desulfocapsaceae bacterium]|nr:hypothetical protein [Desulfocapsaceae bacterium]